MKDKLWFKTLRNATGAVVYIFLVSQFLQNASRWFGEEDNMFSPFVFLMLFSLSAAVVGGLLLGQSIILFFEGKRSESIKAAIYSIGWLGFYTVLGLLFLYIA
jgi:hypothetical protein